MIRTWIWGSSWHYCLDFPRVNVSFAAALIIAGMVLTAEKAARTMPAMSLIA